MMVILALLAVDLLLDLNANKTHCCNSCIVIRVYPLDIPSIKNLTEYLNN